MIKTQLTLGALVASAIGASAAQVSVWQFNNNLNDDVSGSTLSEIGGNPITYSNELIGGVSATIANIPQYSGASQRLFAPNAAGANGTGTNHTNEWTLVMDVNFNSSSFTSLFLNDSGQDAGVFTRSNGAIGGKSNPSISELLAQAGDITTGTWYRLAVTTSIDGSGDRSVSGYIDGVLQATNSTGSFDVDDIHWAIETTGTGDGGFHLFSDNGGDLQSLKVNSVAYYDEALSASAISALGGATASGITAVPEPSSTTLLGLGGLALILRRRK